MPYYFFDITDDKIIHDFKGKQLRDPLREGAPGLTTWPVVESPVGPLKFAER